MQRYPNLLTIDDLPSADEPVGRRASGRRDSAATLWPLYVGLLFLLLAVVVFGLATNAHAGLGTSLYVVLLGAVCFLPLCMSRSVQDRYSLCIAFLAIFFLSFALGDIAALISGRSGASKEASLSSSEWVILVSAISFLCGYRLSIMLGGWRPSGILQREWSPAAVRVSAAIFWTIGITAVYFIQTSFEDVTSSPFWGPLGGVISLARLLNPLGALMAVYLHIKRGDRSALVLFLVFACCDFIMGLYGDTKEQAFRDPILYIFMRFLLTRRVPLVPLVLVFALAGTSFSFFAQFREELKANGRSRSDAMAIVVQSFLSSTAGRSHITSEAPIGERFTAGLDYVASRTGLKASVEVIVVGTGDSAPFMKGRTISPLIYALVPRNLMPGKPDTSVGQTFNRAFKISADPDTYISPSQNGELFWNFGWPGVLVGMLVIGTIIGGVNNAADLSRKISLPRVLLLMLTVYLLCLRFEDGIAIQYTYWLRAVLLLFLVHSLMPKTKQGAEAVR